MVSHFIAGAVPASLWIQQRAQLHFAIAGQRTLQGQLFGCLQTVGLYHPEAAEEFFRLIEGALLDSLVSLSIVHHHGFAGSVQPTGQYPLTSCPELVIEGVETPEQSHALQAIGGEVAQGFLFGKPAPLAHWLKQQ